MDEQPSIILRLASSLDRRDETPNIELAQEIATEKNKDAIEELIAQLSERDKGLQNDSIKVLYEVGEIVPSLIAGYLPIFVELLFHKNNRLQWGAMTAINCIAGEDPKGVYEVLARVMQAADRGSVITRDQAVNILIGLCRHQSYREDAFALLNEQLLKSKPNQFPMYAERSLPIIEDYNRERFKKTLFIRLDELEQESKRKRIEKVLKKLG